MAGQVSRSLLVLLLISLLPASASAQLGRLKQLGREVLEKKAGLTQNTSKPTQWKKGERVSPFTAGELDAFIASWNAQIQYNSLSEKERQRRDQQAQRRRDEYDTKKEKYDDCVDNAMTPADAMELQQEMAQRMMDAAQKGDPNPNAKAIEWMQKAAAQKVEKKCGPLPKKPVVDEAPSMNNMRMEEWLTAYVAVREESDAESAAGVVLASESEMKLLEARLPQLRRLAKGEPLADS